VYYFFDVPKFTRFEQLLIAKSKKAIVHWWFRHTQPPEGFQYWWFRQAQPPEGIAPGG
jgi:hypothetical protein